MEYIIAVRLLFYRLILNKFFDKINSSIARVKNIAFIFTNKFVIGYSYILSGEIGEIGEISGE